MKLPLAQLVADATTEFLAQAKFEVDDLAQYTLLLQGKMREEALAQALAQGELTEEGIKGALKEILRGAQQQAQAHGSSTIAGDDICQAMKGHCPLPPWC